MNTVLLSLWRQRNYRMAIIVALLATLWLLSGVFFGSDEHDGSAVKGASANKPVVETMRVKARKIQAQPYTTRVVVNSRTEPNRSVRLRAELDGVIAALPVQEGEWVEAGAVICELEAEDRPERLALARSALKKAKLDYAGAQKLKGKGLQSESAMAQFEVALASATADWKRAQVEVDNLKIRAPFSGVVNRHAVELGDFIRRGEECGTLLDMDPMLVVGEVAETEVARLNTGAPASAQLQGGALKEGHLRYVSQAADPVTRAYAVEVALANPERQLRSGISARLALPTGEVLAHRVPASLLTLDDRGDLGVRTLDQENRVQFFNIQMISDGEDGVWITGLPAQVTLITVGQEYVNEGEQVRVEFEESAGDLLAPEVTGDPRPVLPAISEATDSAAAEELSR